MLTIHLSIPSNKMNKPLYEQIYSHIKDEIQRGELVPYAKLPSARSLAEHLQVSRNTVDMAYSQLVCEGYIESKPKKGYFVNPMDDFAVFSDAKPALDSAKTEISEPPLYDFSPFAIDITTFPYNIWWKLTKNCLGYGNNDLFSLGLNEGDECLRKAIQNYLHASRGVNCTAAQIIIGAGTDYLLQLLLQILSEDVAIAMENPTYQKAYQIFHGLHRAITPISLDESGICTKQLEDSGSNIVYVTPSHQYPLGVVMPITRRLELLKWAYKEQGRFIIEDDHDSEFRYKGKPIPALQGLDSRGRVIYLGTFSRAIAPAIRISYMVLPMELTENYRRKCSYYSSTVSRIDQRILTSFLEDGYFERHLNRIRKIYKNKHDLLLSELRPLEAEGRIKIEGENAGLHLILRILNNCSEGEFIESAGKVSLKLYGLHPHYIENLGGMDNPVILLGYANISEDKIISGCRALAEYIRSTFDE